MDKGTVPVNRFAQAVSAMIAAAFVSATPVWAEAPAGPAPELARWETNMTLYGQRHCDTLAVLSPGDGFPYGLEFDAERVYYQIATYTGNPSWKFCANAAERLYRDGYVVPNAGGIPGDGVYTHGLLLDHVSSHDVASKEAILLLRHNSLYAGGWLPDIATEPYWASQEVAMAIMAQLDAEALGEPLPPKHSVYISQAMGHVHQWYGQRRWQQPGTPPHQPPLVGLTLHALIHAHERHPDPRIPVAIKLALDGVWETAWRSGEQAFYRSSWEPAIGDPDGNLLIAPAFAWYYWHSGEELYRDRGDAAFASGVTRAHLASMTTFHANYMWSPRYIRWRTDGQAKWAARPLPVPTATQPVCLHAEARPSVLWPPNHKFHKIDLFGFLHPQGEVLTLSIDAIVQDEPVRGLGDGDTGPDATLKDGRLALRAERSGNGDGRVYLVRVTAHDPHGGSCTASLAVYVPVNPGQRSVDSGVRYDSLQP